MFSKYKSLIILLILLFVIPLVGWWVSQTFLLDTKAKEFTTTILNGLWTAYFALVFLGISTILKWISERERKHYNSLVILATQLNEMMGIIKDNIYSMEGFSETIEKGNISWNKIRSITIDKTHLENLFDIDLINKVFTFYINVRKINDDIENLQGGYNEIKDAYIQKYITIDDYIQNAKEVVKNIKQIQDFNEDLFEQVKSLLTRIQIQINKDIPISQIILEKMIYISGNKITIKEFEEEKAILERELDESSRESQEHIERVTKKER